VAWDIYLTAIDDFVLADKAIPRAQLNDSSDRYNWEARRREGASTSQFFGSVHSPSVYNLIFRCPNQDAQDALLSALLAGMSKERRLSAVLGDPAKTPVSTRAALLKIIEQTSLSFEVEFEAGDSFWRSEQSITTRKTITSSRDHSMRVDIPGNVQTAPRLHINPLAQRTTKTAFAGWSKRRRYDITNNGDEPLYRYPVRIDFGSSAAVIAAGNGLANGNDLRVVIDGIEQPRTLVDWNTALSYVWTIIPALLPGDAMSIEVWYGNAAAGTPPVLTYPDLPPFDLSASTNAAWVYNLGTGLGLWWLSKQTEGAIADFGVPGAWQPLATLENPDSQDRTLQLRASSWSGTSDYTARLDAWRGPQTSTVVDATNPYDGVGLYNPLGINSLVAEFDWINIDGWSSLVILARDSASEGWARLLTHTTTEAALALISSATYTPSVPVKWIACAVWPDDFVQLPPRDDTAGTGPTPGDYARAVSRGTWTVNVDSTKLSITLGSTTIEDWVPSYLGGSLRALYQGDKIQGVANGAALRQWDDQSGNGHHAEQDTFSDRPAYETGQLNGLPDVDFDGTDDRLSAKSLGAGSRDETIIAVIRPTTTLDRVIVGGNDNGARVLVRESTGVFTYWRAGSPSTLLATSTGTIAQNAWGIIAVVVTPNSITFSINGTTETPISNTTSLTSSRWTRIGDDTKQGSGTFNGDIAELGFATALGTSDLQKWEGFLAHKYALLGVLPGGHPYKVTEPGGVASATEADIYEIAAEARIGGGEGQIAPYYSVLVGNARQQTGAGTPRAACLLSEAVIIDCEKRTQDIWKADLTAKTGALSAHAVRAVEGWFDGEDSQESPTSLWLPLIPNRPAYPNGGFPTGLEGWEEDTTSDGLTLTRIWDDTVGGESLGSLEMRVTANTAASGAFARTIGPKVFSTKGLDAIFVSAWTQTSNANLIPRLYIVFLDEGGGFLETPVQNTWTPVANTPASRLLAARVPDRAVAYRIGVQVSTAALSATGSVWFDDISPNGPDLYIRDESVGQVEFGLEVAGTWL
jgi:hypothetical protein